MYLIITHLNLKSRVYVNVYTHTYKTVNRRMFIDFFNNKTALWELWGESHNAALLYKMKYQAYLFILLFIQMLLISLGFGNNYAGQSNQSD